MFTGNKIKLGTEEYIIPPISLGQLRNGLLQRLQEHDTLVADNKTFEAMDIRGQIILAALRRNYPDIDENMVFDNLDMNNTGPIWLTILGASGFLPGETEAVGTVTEPGTLSPSIAA
jgi:hypothetical protein